MRLIHYRAVASVWVLFGLAGAIGSVVDGWYQFSPGEEWDGKGFAGLAVAFSLFIIAVVTGIGLLRARVWARITGGLLAFLLGLYCLAFVMMVEGRFGGVFLAAAFLGIAFAAFTFLVVFRPGEATPPADPDRLS